MFILLIKRLISLMLALLIFSCSEKSMNKLGLRKEQSDAYAVSRKNPLTMPPDMTLRPPIEKDGYDSSLIKNKSSDSDSVGDMSIDEILIGSNTKENRKSKNNKNAVDLVTRILKTKIDAVLK